MQFDSEYADGKLVIRATAKVRYNLTASVPHIIIDGVYIPIKIINQDLVQVGNKLIHRSALEEGGWVEHRLEIPGETKQRSDGEV